jgi:dTDP-4-dehydrorhamnose 3,5-epimerase
MAEKAATTALAVDGAVLVELDRVSDERGSFTELFRRSWLHDAGLPEVDIVQQNLATNHLGSTRGVHAEPWDKYVTVVAGRAFQVVVDLRPGESWGRADWFELVPGRALFVPRGCGNAYQALEPNTLYTYLVTDYWTTGTRHLAVDPFDDDLAIPWPIGQDDCILSTKDRNNPSLKELRESLDLETHAG